MAHHEPAVHNIIQIDLLECVIHRIDLPPACRDPDIVGASCLRIARPGMHMDIHLPVQRPIIDPIRPIRKAGQKEQASIEHPMGIKIAGGACCLAHISSVHTAVLQQIGMVLLHGYIQAVPRLYAEITFSLYREELPVIAAPHLPDGDHAFVLLSSPICGYHKPIVHKSSPVPASL